MASSSKQGQGAGVLTPRYMALLQSLCRRTNPTVDEVTAIFNEVFRRALGAGRSRPSLSSTVSRAWGAVFGGLKKRVGGGRLAGRGRGRKTSKGDDPDDDDDDEDRSDRLPYERACTCQRDEKRCWLIDELDAWNRILAKAFFEVREHKWGELTLQGYGGPLPIAVPVPLPDLLRASLLMHLMIRQHRCVVRIVLDLMSNDLEPVMVWHAIKTFSHELEYLEYRANDAHYSGTVPQVEGALWSHAVESLQNLHTLTLLRGYFDREVVRALGRFAQRSTSLVKLVIKSVTVDGDSAAIFLDQLARNTSLNILILEHCLMKDRAGEALADFLLKHVAIERLEIIARNDVNPSVIMRASVRSPSLKSLSLSECNIEVADIRYMADALSRPAPPTPPEGEKPPPESPTGGLQQLTFIRCKCKDPQLQKAYASLIGGVLRHLTFTACELRDAFASEAALELHTDKRLKHLYVQHNRLSIAGNGMLLEVLRKNTTVEELSINITRQPDVRDLLSIIKRYKLSSRVIIGWKNPDGMDFREGHDLCKISSASFNLDYRYPCDSTLLLDTLVIDRKINALTLTCTAGTTNFVVNRMIDTLGRIKYLRHLHLNAVLQEPATLGVFRALQVNSSIETLFLNLITFERRVVRALGRLVLHNKTINLLSIDLDKSRGDKWSQLRAICRELKQTVPQNRYLISVSVVLQGDNRASDFLIKETLRHNFALVHQAIQFVNGSMNKSEGLAFETLRRSYSVRQVMQDEFGVAESDAWVKIGEARDRLNKNYFILTKVVQRGIACSSGEYTIASLNENLLARLCSYLSLSDVIDTDT
ncbi:uncharacterized protein LOC119164680 [Rhipicephalus microplus]|uniref:uncharacterized protein LOC119164680 n=1 Tax=Rhipicephalus microplus TaxID=6941 RepID=UPI003F6C974A